MAHTLRCGRVRADHNATEDRDEKPRRDDGPGGGLAPASMPVMAITDNADIMMLNWD